MNTRAKYQAPKLEVQQLRELPSALASSSCHATRGGGTSCTVAGTHGSDGRKTTFKSH